VIDRVEEASGRSVSRETFGRLEAYVALLLEASTTQSLIAKSTVDEVWDRHIVDCAQLLRFAEPSRSWLDIGAGAGLPGIVIAILDPGPATLLEPRRLRVEFLASVIDRLGLTNVTLVQGKTTALTAKYRHITARAVAPASDLLTMSRHLSHPETVWVLPKGRSAQKELDEVRGAWQGSIRLEPSLTDPDASILLASGIRPRGRR
jgi:16S rRNA (guanine527-N7)-methyltransferase